MTSNNYRKSDQKWVETILCPPCKKMFTITGKEFFDTFTLHAWKFLEADFALIGEITGGNRVVPVSYQESGSRKKDLPIPLGHDFVESLLRDRFCFFPEAVQEKIQNETFLKQYEAEGFYGAGIYSYEGKPLGIIMIIKKTPLKLTDYILDILELLALKTTDELEKRCLKEIIKKQELLLQEIHHRVKNNFQIISSLLSLELWNIKDKNDFKILLDSQNRIHTMALVHQQIYRSDNVVEVNMNSYIGSLITNIIYIYNVDINKIELRKEIQNVRLPVSTCISCGLIVTELLSNTIRIVTKEGADAIVTVTIEEEDQTSVKIRIVIEGKIRREKLDLFNIDSHDTESLSMQLVETLIDQLNGSVSTINSDKYGWEICFPLP